MRKYLYGLVLLLLISGISGWVPSQKKYFDAAHMFDVAERQSFFALEGIDLEELKQAVDALQNVVEGLAVRQKTLPQVLSIRYLYPVKFLSSLVSLERIRREFTASESGADAQRLKWQVEETLRAYRSDLENFEEAFLENVPENIPPYHTLAGVVSRESILASIGELKSSVGKRARGIVTALPLETRSHRAEDIVSIYRSAGIKFVGPLIWLSNSVCVPSSYGPAVFAVREGSPSSPNSRSLVYVGDILLVDVKKTPTSFYKFFADRGVNYWPYSPVSTYTCPDLGEEYARASLGFENIVWRLVEELRSDIALADAGVPVGFNAKDLFYLRSLFFTLYLGNNPSAVGIQTGPVRQAGGPSAGSIFIRYSSGSLLREEVLRSVRYFVDIHTDAGSYLGAILRKASPHG